MNEQQKQLPKQYYIGWDVGAWHCDSNKNSQDAIAILDHNLTPVGGPWRGNLSELILELGKCNDSQSTDAASSKFLKGLFRLCLKESIAIRVESELRNNPPKRKDRTNRKKELEEEHEGQELEKHFPSQEEPIYCIAIDTPLGWPVKFHELLDCWAGGQTGDGSLKHNQCFDSSSVVLSRNKIGNPLLHRKTETNFGECFSVIQDMIGSQSTKAICLLVNLKAKRISTGVWETEGPTITFIETYPAPCMRSLTFLNEMKEIKLDTSVKSEDTLDALVCAMVSKKFMDSSKNESLTEPSAVNDVEGWIFTPDDYLEPACGVSYSKLVNSDLCYKELLNWVALGIVMKSILKTINSSEKSEAASSDNLPGNIINWLRECHQSSPDVISSCTADNLKKYFKILNSPKANSGEEEGQEKRKKNKQPTDSQFETIASVIKNKACP